MAVLTSSVVVKALRYQSDGPGIDSRWCYRGFFPWLPPKEPCALGSTQPLKMSSRDFSWGKGGLCLWLTTYHACSAERQEKPGALTYPEPLGPVQACCGMTFYLRVQNAFIFF
jgi:hypothetical protein